MHETITITFDWDGRRARNLEHGYTMADGRWRAVSESLINAQEQGSQQIHVIRTVMEHDHLMIMKTLRFAINRTVWHTPRTSDTSMDDGQAKKLQSASTACWLAQIHNSSNNNTLTIRTLELTRRKAMTDLFTQLLKLTTIR